MKYRHFPAAALAAGLLFCALFSGLIAYADDKKGELTQKQTEAHQEYDAAQSALNELKSAQAQTENEVAALTGQAAELAGQITDVTAAVQAAQTELDVRRTAAEAADATLTAKQAEYDARLALCKEQLRAMQRLDGGGALLVRQPEKLLGFSVGVGQGLGGGQLAYRIGRAEFLADFPVSPVRHRRHRRQGRCFWDGDVSDGQGVQKAAS